MTGPNENALAGGTAQGAEGADFGRLRINPITPRRRPRQSTTRAAILDALLAGGQLTSLDAWREYSASRLAAHVFALRHMGWPIAGKVTRVRCKGGRVALVTAYYMADLAPGERHGE